MENKSDFTVAHAGEFVVGGFGEIVAADFHSAGGGGIEAAEEVHKSGFAAPARADDGDELTLFDAEIDLIECPYFLIADAIDFAEAFEVDEAHDLDFFEAFLEGSAGSTRRTSSPSRMPDWISASFASIAPTVTSRRTGLPSSST